MAVLLLQEPLNQLGRYFLDWLVAIRLQLMVIQQEAATVPLVMAFRGRLAALHRLLLLPHL